MVAFKLQNFGGMIPAVDDRLLPQDAAALAQNTWLYSGALQGMHLPKTVHTLTNPVARKVYRIPIQYYDKDHINDSYWLEFQNLDTDVIRSPTVDDTYERFYWASAQDYYQETPRYNTKARIIAGQSSFKLGVPTPTTAPRLSIGGGAYSMAPVTGGYYQSTAFAPMKMQKNFGLDSSSTQADLDRVAASDSTFRLRVTGNRMVMAHKTADQSKRITLYDSTGGNTTGETPQPTTPGHILESRSYVYTWVTAYGEEGAPSPATVLNAYTDDVWRVSVTAPTTSQAAERNITTVRLYRTVTSSAGGATYFFVDDWPIAQTTYEDSITNDIVTGNAQLQSLYWTPPPDDLEGMITMPNGMIAGWRGNEVWFCEQYRPHAWPSTYTVAVEYPVVGLGVTGQTLIICTTGYPYAAMGINPASISMSRIATYEPCTSRGSIVSSVEGVIYASPNGLVLAAAGQVNVITRQMATKDRWQELIAVDTIRATKMNGAYYCWGSVRPGCFDSVAYEPTAFLEEDFTGAYSGAIVDFANQRTSWTALYYDYATYNTITDPWTGEIFLIRDGKVEWLDIASSNHDAPFLWRSKTFELANKRNFEAMRVFFNIPTTAPTLNPVPNTNLVQTLAADQYGLVRMFANGVLVYTREIRVPGELFRLPSGFKSIYWQVEIEARVPIYSVEVATSAKELINV